MESAPILQLKNVTKNYSSDSVAAVNSVNLTLGEGELLGLLGPSGCGKTTLLRIVAGFEKVSQGEVCLSGRTIGDRNVPISPPKNAIQGWFFKTMLYFPI